MRRGSELRENNAKKKKRKNFFFKNWNLSFFSVLAQKKKTKPLKNDDRHAEKKIFLFSQMSNSKPLNLTNVRVFFFVKHTGPVFVKLSQKILLSRKGTSGPNDILNSRKWM